MQGKALFLDRDGVVNRDSGYVYKSEDIRFIDGIFHLCLRAQRLGYLIFVVTNQAGIGRGYYTEEQFHELTEWIHGRFLLKGAEIAKTYYCPYHPLYGVGRFKLDAECRKPKPGMILQAAREYNLDLSRSVLVGDKASDVQAGVSAGVGCNLLYRPPGSLESTERGSAIIVCSLHGVGAFL